MKQFKVFVWFNNPFANAIECKVLDIEAKGRHKAATIAANQFRDYPQQLVVRAFISPLN